ncbi:NAD(P)-binding domain-containing protein [Streptomyces sp. NPDC089919]|uniref:NADPH-dependent F420 reductase n=1 Tax=Streptomyces sp. NPDC089919 TaxID=3155188 RepID=UPI0034464450
MRYAVFGTGVVGRTLAARLAGLGHDVVVGTRDPEHTLARAEADDRGNAPFAQWLAEHPSISLDTFDAAAAGAETLVNTTAGGVTLEVLAAVAPAHLDGKVLIDIANPLDFSKGFPPSLEPVNTDSLGEQVQRAHPALRVVKTLNTMNCAIMVDPARVEGDHTVFLSGDDADAKKSVTELLTSFGWQDRNILDLGGIETARGTEMLLPIWLRIMGSAGHADFNFHIQGV